MLIARLVFRRRLLKAAQGERPEFNPIKVLAQLFQRLDQIVHDHVFRRVRHRVWFLPERLVCCVQWIQRLTRGLVPTDHIGARQQPQTWRGNETVSPSRTVLCASRQSPGLDLDHNRVSFYLDE